MRNLASIFNNTQLEALSFGKEATYRYQSAGLSVSMNTWRPIYYKRSKSRSQRSWS